MHMHAGIQPSAHASKQCAAMTSWDTYLTQLTQHLLPTAVRHILECILRAPAQVLVLELFQVCICRWGLERRCLQHLPRCTIRGLVAKDLTMDNMVGYLPLRE